MALNHPTVPKNDLEISATAAFGKICFEYRNQRDSLDI
jgi:hypothetical protein